jgi:large subunit ribosomal protein L32
MPQEPKKRHSRQRQGKRRTSIQLFLQNAVACPNCGNLNPPHTICKKCGFYKGRNMNKNIPDKKILASQPQKEPKQETK